MELTADTFDTSKCKTHRVFGTDVYWCLACSPRPHECPYAMSFGYSFMCRHPDRGTFVDTTSVKQVLM